MVLTKLHVALGLGIPICALIGMQITFNFVTDIMLPKILKGLSGI